jgi:hypothetical protein
MNREDAVLLRGLTPEQLCARSLFLAYGRAAYRIASAGDGAMTDRLGRKAARAGVLDVLRPLDGVSPRTQSETLALFYDTIEALS